jgi:hypothetical protein
MEASSKGKKEEILTGQSDHFSTRVVRPIIIEEFCLTGRWQSGINENGEICKFRCPGSQISVVLESNN